LLIFFLCCVVIKVGTLSELPNLQKLLSEEQGRDFKVPTLLLSSVMMMCALMAVMVTFFMFFVQFANERARIRREAKRQAMPTCGWNLAQSTHFCRLLGPFQDGGKRSMPLAQAEDGFNARLPCLRGHSRLCRLG
jgi:hypothetical protein